MEHNQSEDIISKSEIFRLLKKKSPMNAYIRYRVINSLLVNNGRATLRQMIQACEDALDIKPISKRTIEADLHVMRNDARLAFHAPIKYIHAHRAYMYTDPDYTIDHFRINLEEVQTLRFASTVLKQFQHTEYLTDFEGTVQKIFDTIDKGKLSEDDPDMSFIQFEKSPLIRGAEYLQPLIDCIQEEKVIHITYRKFALEEPNEYILHPYLLKEYRSRWYLIAFHEDKDMIKIFSLERIQGITLMPLKTYLTKIIDFDNFFKNSIGITLYDEEPVDILITFSRLQSDYLATQPLHPTQMLLKEKEGSFTFKFHLVPTPEFTATLLGWGDQAEVQEPQWYRRELALKVENMNSLYKN